MGAWTARRAIPANANDAGRLLSDSSKQHPAFFALDLAWVLVLHGYVPLGGGSDAAPAGALRR